jgi:hypothetical protein
MIRSAVPIAVFWMLMTKIEVDFELNAPLDEEAFQHISDAHGVYGLLMVRPNANLDGVRVHYDASRLSRDEVEGALVRLGIPIRREQPAY